MLDMTFLVMYVATLHITTKAGRAEEYILREEGVGFVNSNPSNQSSKENK